MNKRTKNEEDAGMLTTQQAAEKLGLKKTTLEALRCRGGGPVFVKYAKAIRYTVDALDTYIREHTRTSTSEYETRGGRVARKVK